MNSLVPTYTHGTHRLLTPEQTLNRIIPHLHDCGITRCADITSLDVDLGVPTYCAIRPTGLVLQTSNGKGLTPLSAQVSALMEAIELHHAETPEPHRLRRSSLTQLTQQGLQVIRPEQLGDYYDQFFTDDYVIDWVEGQELVSEKPVWVPASAVYFCEPSLYRTSTNGLASGNHLIEATLHALYELIERDAISNVDVNGRLKIKEKCKIIDTTTITDDSLRQVISKIDQAESKLILLWVQSSVPVHTFWAILLNQNPFGAVSTFNVGFGTHLDINVAAARAITEAVQSRLTLIHGSREDIITKPVYQAGYIKNSPAFNYFNQLRGDILWQLIRAQVSSHHSDLWRNYIYLLAKLSKAGHHPILRFDLTRSDLEIPVVKVIVPTLRFNRKILM